MPVAGRCGTFSPPSDPRRRRECSENVEAEVGDRGEAAGNRITDTDGRGNDTDHTYDLFDRRTKTTNALGHYTQWEYDKNSNTTKVMRKDSADVEIQRETYYFDTRNRQWKTSALFKDPATTHSDAVTLYERLKTGQLEKLTNPRGKVTTARNPLPGLLPVQFRPVSEATRNPTIGLRS